MNGIIHPHTSEAHYFSLKLASTHHKTNSLSWPFTFYHFIILPDQILPTSRYSVLHSKGSVNNIIVMPDLIRPLTYVALRLPSDSLLVLEVVPNTYVI